MKSISALLGLFAFLSLAPLTACGQFIDENDREILSVSQPAETAQADDRPPASPSEGRADVRRAAEMIIEQTNAFRAEEGLPPVSAVAELQDAAEYFAQYMGRTHRYGHQADDQRPSDRAAQHGYEFCIVSENIAYQYHSRDFETSELAKRFVEGWKDSPRHRENMLDPDLTETGVAVARGESGYYFAVQMFGRPQSLRIEFEVSNRYDESIEYEVGDRRLTLPPRYTRTHQSCRPPVVTIQAPAASADAEPRELEMQSGDRIEIDGRGQLQIERGQQAQAAEPSQGSS